MKDKDFAQLLFVFISCIIPEQKHPNNLDMR